MADGEEDEDSVRAMQVACTEARYTMDQQIEKIHQEDRKAIGISRVNLLLLSILATGIAVSLRYEQVDPTHFLNTHVVLGTVILIFSSIVASMAYTSSRFEMGINPTAISEIKNGERDRAESFDKLVGEYAEWIKRNRRVHQFNSYAITWALIFATAGLIFFLGGFLVGILQNSGSLFSIVLLVGEIFVVLIVAFCLYNSDSIFNLLMDIQNDN